MAGSSGSFFPMDPLYINERRVAALMGVERFTQQLGNFSGWNDKQSQHLRALRCAEILRGWIDQFGNEVRSFQAAMIRNELKPRTLITYEGTLWSRNARSERRRVAPLAYAKLERGDLGEVEVQLRLALHPDHVVVGSAGDRLRGKLADIFVLAQVEEVEQEVVQAIPVFIGYLGEYRFMGDFFPPSRNEVFVDGIETFEAVRNVPRPSTAGLRVLAEVSENDIKVAFAEVIGEHDVPKDWGGERSDLYTTYVRLEGKRISSAFMFKGPAGGKKFREMQISDLGKNGDQIERLCTEPADMVVVQHCHKIGTGVRSTLRAFCNQVGRQRKYCLVDGADTLRVLKAYGKCGL